MKTCLILLLSALCPPFFAVGQALEPFAPKSAVPPGWRLIHGDILEPAEAAFQPAGVFRSDPARYWPGGLIPYEFDANVTAANQSAMLTAMGLWKNAATLNFIPRNGEADYVHIQNSTGNNSAAGRVGGQQFINIISWGAPVIIAHELGHCLGYWHTQSRPDRDNFVRINWANIQAGREDQFDFEEDIRTYGPYDFDSLMHYDQCAFSTDCPAGSTCGCTHTTIDVRAPNESWQTRIGQRDHLSYWDKTVMSFLYPPANERFVNWAFAGSESGTFLQPYRTFLAAKAGVPAGGQVRILRPGNYFALGTHSKRMTISAPLGGVTLGN